MSTQDTFFPTKPKVVSFPKWAWTANYRVVTPALAREALNEIVQAPAVAWDSEFKPGHAGNDVSAFSFSTAPNTGWMLPVAMHHMPNMPMDVVKKFIWAIGRKHGEKGRNIVQNAGAEMLSCDSLWPGEEHIYHITDDVQVVWYLRDPNESKDFKEGGGSGPRRRGGGMPAGFSLTQMALKYLKTEIPDLSSYFKSGGNFADLDPEIARVYACSDADVTLRLWQLGCDPALRDSFIYKLDFAMLEVIYEMERNGFPFRKDRLQAIEEKVRVAVAEAKEVAYEALKMPRDQKVDSATQLRRHIFNVLGWPGFGKKTKDGLWSVDKTAMARYAESADPAIAEGAKAFQEYKKLFTLHNNFLTKLDQYVNPLTGAIHCRLLSTVVPTGRLACAAPNLQQVPQRRDDIPLRQAFYAPEGWYLMEADHSQVELRVYAGETQENYYFESFSSDVDLHCKTAEIIFREPPGSMTKKDPRRQMGKTMNFGPIYGMKPEGLAMRTDYTLAEAEQILDDFFSVMPTAVQWTRDCHRKSKEMGGVYTHFGRWRPLPWLHSRIPGEIEFGERSAVNTIVQGTAADILKIGLVRLYRELKNPDCVYHGKAKMILTVHDSVILLIRDEVDPYEFFAFLEKQLCFPVEGYPPLAIDAKIGRNWHDMDDLELDEHKPLPDTEDQLVEDKALAIPYMTEEQRAGLTRLLGLVSPGSLKVKVLDSTTGEYLTGEGFIPMDGSSYQNLLTYCITVARQNQVHALTTPDDVLRVSLV
jgi:DNA polymerase I-like protein with 3'-5' exonuclease and polymerase domains